MTTTVTYGRAGKPVRVTTNSYEILTLPRVPFYQYDLIAQQQVDGSPPKVLPPGRRYREIVDKMQDSYVEVFTPRACFDGSRLLYSSKHIPGSTYDVNMSNNPNAKGGRFRVQITAVATIQPNDLSRLVTTEGAQQTPAGAVATNLLQILVSQAPNVKYNFALHSKSFYIDRQARDLPSGLQAWTGFFQSVRPVLNKVLINVDTTTAAVYKPGSLLSAAMAVLGCRDARSLIEVCHRDKQAWMKLRKFLKNVTVKAYPAKRGKIAELVLEGGKYEFLKDGEIMTVEEHFLKHYAKQIRDPRAFGVRLGKDAVYPAEVCEILPGQIYKKKLDPSDMTEFLRSSVMKPADRLNAIGQAVQSDLQYLNSPWMKEAGLTVSNRPLEISGRELRAPNVQYASSQLTVKGGAWNVLNQTFQVPAKILAWAVVCFDSSNRAQEAVNRLAQTLFQNLKKLGVVFFLEPPASVTLGNQGDVASSLDEAAHAAREKLKQTPNCPVKDPQVTFILVILPQNAAVLRKQVKQWGDMMRGIATQCVRQGKYEKANDQYCNNLALKINMKCGGINSFVRSSVNSLIRDSMIVGCDVTHPSPGVANRPSIASVVSSVDPEATRYHCMLAVQEPRQEIIGEIKSMMQNAFMDYQKVRNSLPRYLFVFRDGVSEGEYSQLLNTEIRDLEDLLGEVRQRFNHETELVFIVVGKRHHIRFFPNDTAQPDRSGNCNPGLVIDREIVNSTYMDYYLQSHAGILGTSRPSHYVVLKNQPQLSADQLQELSYSLCHVYAAATRSVSIPAPVYYADRACARAEFHFRPELDYADENSSTNTNFNLKEWQKGFGQSLLRRAMYFV